MDEDPRALLLPPGLALACMATAFWVGLESLLLVAAFIIVLSAGVMSWFGRPGIEAWQRALMVGGFTGTVAAVPVGLWKDFEANFCIFDCGPYSPVGWWWGLGLFGASIALHLAASQLSPARASEPSQP